MVKGKVGKEALKKFSRSKFAKGAGVAGGARAAEEAVSNPYAQAALGAAEGAALGSALGPLGAAGGAVAGGLLGFVLADGERIVPCDMVAIPAYQYASVLQGREPTFQVFIKEGEVIQPVIPTDFEIAGNVVLQDSLQAALEIKPKRKLSKWQRYIKVKKNQIKFKNGKLDLKKMGRAYRRLNRGSK